MSNTNTTMTENKMGVMPVNKLIITMSTPIIISMLIQALYNVVDSIFVSRVSENALTAVSLAFPVQVVIIAMGVGAAVGMNSALSRALGAKDFAEVNKIAGNGFFTAILNSVLFLIVGILFSGAYFRSITDNAEIVELGTSYLMICTAASFGVFFQIIAERLLQSTGRTVLSMAVQAVGAIINIILDPILIFGLFGFPELGISGAAIATVIGQIIAGILGVYLNAKYNKEIKLELKNLKPEKATIFKIYKVGLPSIIMQSIGSVTTYGLSLILISFTETATAVLGVYYKIQSIFIMPVLGLNSGVIPIIAYNYGAGKPERIKQATKYVIIYACALMWIGLVVFQIFPDQLLRLFDASEDMLEIGRVALRVGALSFVFAGLCIGCSAVYQGLGNGVYSMIISFCRQLIILLPAAYLLSLTGEVNAVWWAIPIAELMSVTLSLVFLKRINRNVVAKIKTNN